MEKNSTASRLHAFDGIRGLAIILVILNHVDISYIHPQLPDFFTQMIFGSGITGVSLLFLLSGFFMAYIYPHPDKRPRFLQKRYTRIFPLFVTMCTIMLFFRIFPNLQWYFQISIIFLFSVTAHFFWVNVIRKKISTKGKRIFFLSFLLLQLFIALVYVLWIMRQPAIVFNQQIPLVLKESFVGMVNAILTLPFGDYIPMLDGVYWSLVAEVYFYILYPIVCIPLINLFLKSGIKTKMFGLLLLIPFFWGMSILSRNLFVFSMLQIYLCFYFIPGIVLGIFFRHHKEKIQNLHHFFPGFLHYIALVLFLVLIFVKPLVLNLGNQDSYPLIHMLWSIPLVFFFAVALDQNTALSKFLNTKILLFLGTISYSVYLSHTAILHIVQKTYQSKGVIGNVVVILVIFSLTVFISSILYYLLERPYFKRDRRKDKITQFKLYSFPNFVKKPVFILLCLFLLSSTAIFSAYQSNFNLFSIEHRFPSSIFTSANTTTNISSISTKQSKTINLVFQSPEDNLSIIAMHLKSRASPSSKQEIIFRLKEADQTDWYATNAYSLSKIGNSKEHPFGFPPIKKAKGRKFLVEITQTKPSSSEYLVVYTDSVKAIYPVSKSNLIKHPTKLFKFLSNRVDTVVTNPQAKLITLLLLPFFLFSFTYLGNVRLKRKDARN